MWRCFASTGVAPILPESHRMPAQQTIEASQHTRGPLTPGRRPVQTSEVVDTPTRTRAWNSVVAVLFLVVAMWGGYTAIGLPPVVIVGGSGVVAFVIWQRSYLRRPLDPSVILPLFLLTVAALDVHMAEEYLARFGPAMSRLINISWTELPRPVHSRTPDDSRYLRDHSPRRSEGVMRVLVAGANGALGVPLTRLLVARGHSVVGLIRNPAGADGVRALGAEPVVADALERDELLRAVNGLTADAVIHELTSLRKPPLRANGMAVTNDRSSVWLAVRR
jgi:hypothetical protein